MAYTKYRHKCLKNIYIYIHHTTFAPLQRVINAAVRLVDGLGPRDHATAAVMALR